MTAHSTKNRRTLHRSIAAALFVAVLAGTGCYGTFPLTNMIYRANGRVTKYGVVHSIVMIVLVIIPVYQVCMIVDALLLNLIEFWSGDDMELSSTSTLPDGTVATLAPGATKDEAILTMERDGEVTLRRTFRRIDTVRTLVLDDSGTVLSAVDRTPQGGLVFRDARGQATEVYSQADLNQLIAAVPAQ